jgi:hypothetical protein
MSDDAQEQDDSPVIIGDPIDPDEFQVSLVVTSQSIDDSIDWWDERADDLYIGALEWNA